VFQPGNPKPYPDKQPGCHEDLHFSLLILEVCDIGGGVGRCGGRGGCGGGGGVQNYTAIPARRPDFNSFKNNFLL
jgi:hypothetical protein